MWSEKIKIHMQVVKKKNEIKVSVRQSELTVTLVFMQALHFLPLC